jgi:hypothetical protein
MKNTSSAFYMLVAAAEWQLQAHYVASLNGYLNKVAEAAGLAEWAHNIVVPEWVISASAVIAIIAGAIQLFIVFVRIVRSCVRGTAAAAKWIKNKICGDREA